MRITPLVSVAGALSLAAGGCGAQTSQSAGRFRGPQKPVAQAIDDLSSAGSKGDAKKICDSLLAKPVVQSLNQAGSDCQKAVKDQLKDADDFQLKVQSVTVNGTSATAKVKSQFNGKDHIDTLGLVKEGPAWKIATLG
jgi:hypothetical protein